MVGGRTWAERVRGQMRDGRLDGSWELGWGNGWMWTREGVSYERARERDRLGSEIWVLLIEFLGQGRRWKRRKMDERNEGLKKAGVLKPNRSSLTA